MYVTEILLNTATIREVNLTGIDSNFTARETQDYAPLQSQATKKQALSGPLKTFVANTWSKLVMVIKNFPSYFVYS